MIFEIDDGHDLRYRAMIEVVELMTEIDLKNEAKTGTDLSCKETLIKVLKYKKKKFFSNIINVFL